MSVVTPKILIVDDEPDFLDTCKRLLERVGFDCVTADDAPVAIALIDSLRPGLVITDLNLPRGDGFDVARHARACVPSIPAVIVTAYHTSDTARRARDEGANEYLPKPFSNKELVEVVTRIIPSPPATPTPGSGNAA